MPEDTFNVAFREIESDSYLSTVGNDGSGMIPLVITDLGSIFSRKGGYTRLEKREKVQNIVKDTIPSLVIPFLSLIISAITAVNQHLSEKSINYQQKTLDSLSKKVYALDSMLRANSVSSKSLKPQIKSF